MTDLEDLRKRYADFKRHCVCGATWEASEYTVLHQCPSCDGYETWQATRDEGVLALCDEVEALRQTVRGCETCGGDGMMMVPAGYNEDEVGDLRPEVCAECHGTCVSSWGQAIDEAAALRAEVEALRAQAAAAPVVLMEWPTVESAMLLKLEGSWCYVTRSAAIGDAMHVGYFTPGGRGPVFIVSRERVIQRDDFRPGEFFVRVP